MPIFEAKPAGNRLDRWWAKRVSRMFNDSWLNAVDDGRLRWPFGRGKIKNLAGSYDFIGINYYTRYYVKFPPGKNFSSRNGKPMRLSAMAIMARFILMVFTAPSNKCYAIRNRSISPKMDCLIATDKHRPAFIMDHLRQIWQAISFCYPVMGYYHWSSS